MFNTKFVHMTMLCTDYEPHAWSLRAKSTLAQAILWHRGRRLNYICCTDHRLHGFDLFDRPIKTKQNIKTSLPAALWANMASLINYSAAIKQNRDQLNITVNYCRHMMCLTAAWTGLNSYYDRESIICVYYLRLKASSANVKCTVHAKMKNT